MVAGGSGQRFGSAKQFESLGPERVIDRSVRVAAESCDGVVAVVPEQVLGDPEGLVPGADRVIGGGATRSESSRLGVDAVPGVASVILIHDAARPLADRGVYERVINEVRSGAQAVVPVVAVTDTIRDLDGSLVDRDRLRSVQTPQGFDADVIRSSLEHRRDTTDDAAAAAASGHEVVMVDGDPINSKITTRADLAVARMMITGDVATGGQR